MTTALKLSLEEFERMIGEGRFDGFPPRRVELIRGEMREVSPAYAPHDFTIELLDDWSQVARQRRLAAVRVQLSLRLPRSNTLVVPDLAWVVPKRYRRQHPGAADALLLIEVSDSSLRFDRFDKGQVYAEEGIEDYWIINLHGRCIEVYRDPGEDGYRTKHTFGPGETVHPLRFPDVALSVDELFPANEPVDDE